MRPELKNEVVGYGCSLAAFLILLPNQNCDIFELDTHNWYDTHDYISSVNGFS